MRDIILPRKQRRKDIIKSLRSEKNSVAARDRRILEFRLAARHLYVEREKLLQY